MGESMNDDEIRTAFGELLSRREYSLFLTLTFRDDATEHAALRAFARYVAYLRRRFGEFDFVRVLERGTASERLHLHVLIGGIPATPSVRNDLTAAWSRFWGIADVAEFDRTRAPNAFRYLLKTVSTLHTDQIDFHFRSDEHVGVTHQTTSASLAPATARAWPLYTEVRAQRASTRVVARGRELAWRVRARALLVRWGGGPQ